MPMNPISHAQVFENAAVSANWQAPRPQGRPGSSAPQWRLAGAPTLLLAGESAQLQGRTWMSMGAEGRFIAGTLPRQPQTRDPPW